MRQHFDLYHIAIVHVGDFDRLPTANLVEIHARPSHVRIDIFLSLSGSTSGTRARASSGVITRMKLT